MANIRNIIGQVARKDNFFPRTKLIEKLYQKLADGNHILLSAPRRVGKSSIMRYLSDKPKEGYEFIYVYVEPINTVEDFCDELLTEIQKSKAVGKMTKAKSSVSEWFKSINIEVQGIKLESNPNEKLQRYAQQLDKVWEELGKNDFTTVIMIDEFPQAIENINLQQQSEMAKLFLHLCRKQRQQVNEKVRFIYTGSIGLPSVVSKITSQAVINDLTPFEVPPLSRKDAKEMMIALMNSHKIDYELEIIDTTLSKLDWLIPFNIQLIVQELIDIYENTEEKLKSSDVAEAIKRAIHTRNNQYFSSYQDRLSKAFPDENNYNFAISLLNKLSQQENVSDKQEISTLGNTFSLENKAIQNILESLEYDGYIFCEEDGFRFNSLLLKMWWKKNVAL